MYLRCFDSLESTNQYCELLDLATVEEFTVISTREQTAGIGQRGNCWNAEPGKNVTFSLVLKPVFLPMEDQYMLTKAVSLGIADWLSGILPHGQQVRIKWPNDIYVGEKKICGVLISTRVQRNRLATAIVGVGLNVNQTVFPDWVPNPTSLKLITGKEMPTEEALKGVVGAIDRRYRQLQATFPDHTEEMDAAYLSSLLNLGKECAYLYHDKTIRAVITGVNRFGHLELVTTEGDKLVCQLKELKLLLDELKIES